MTSLSAGVVNKALWCVAMLAVIVAFPSITSADTSSINSAVITSHVFNDVPTAIFTGINNYPSSISLSESGVSSANGFANRDVWQFSSNGTSAYQFQNGDYFDASFDLKLTADPISPRKEAGFIFSTTSSGDIQFAVNSDGHEVVQFGGISLWFFSPGISYNSGDTIHLGFSYFLDGNGKNALQFSANGVNSPVFDFDTNVGVGALDIGNGSTLGGYLQVVNDPSNPSNGGTALFSNINIAGVAPVSQVPEPSSLMLLGSGLIGCVQVIRRRVRR